MDHLDEYLSIAIDLAKKSGEMMIEWHKKGSFEIHNKTSDKDLVTEVDIKIEQFIFNSLKQHFPEGHRFIGEESTDSSCMLDSNDPTWIVDPIDGTFNFAHYFPMCSVSIGLAINKELVLGVINCPFIERIYSATKNGGAKCNGQPIKVSSIKEIPKALVLCEIPIGASQHPKYQNMSRQIFETILWKCQAYRNVGSACVSMCMIAEGSVDAYVHSGLKIWDMAAGYVIIKEAGGVIRKINGDPFDPNGSSVLAACNEVLADSMAERLREAIQSYKKQ